MDESDSTAHPTPGRDLAALEAKRFDLEPRATPGDGVARLAMLTTLEAVAAALQTQGAPWVAGVIDGVTIHEVGAVLAALREGGRQ